MGNLAVNTRDAMPYGGKLIIETGLQNIDDAFAREHSMTAGRYNTLADNVTGMDEATPSAEHKLGAEAEIHAEELPCRREGVTILLAEDDAIMRKLTCKMLEQHGYTVFEAVNGIAALDRIGGNHHTIDITLTAVVMKGMNGPELVLKLMDSHPAMKVVYMSGSTGELVTYQGLSSGIKLLKKPFTRAALLRTLDTALG